MLPRKILFCTDFSENAEPARQLALEYAKAFGAELIIVHVIDSWAAFPTYVDWLTNERQDFLGRIQETARARLDAMGKECAREVSEVKTYLKLGLPAKEIARIAQEEKADLVVLGTHGWTGVRHLLVGSVARNILRTVHRPVLIVESPISRIESPQEPDEFPAS